MLRTFTLDQARALLPAVQRQADGLVSLRPDLAELAHDLGVGLPSTHGGVPELKALQARLDETLGWFAGQGLSVKGFAPLLLDFPSSLDGADVLLCWLEGETRLDWYHKPELGFAGRRRIATGR